MSEINMDLLVLGAGYHTKPQGSNLLLANLLEAVAYVAGEDFTSYPDCVSKVLAGYGRHLCESLPHTLLQGLKPFIPRLIGTADDGRDEARSYLALNWLYLEHAPALLRLVPKLAADADRLENLSPITSAEGVIRVGKTLQKIQKRAQKALDAAIKTASGRGMIAAGDMSDRVLGTTGEGAAGAAAWPLACEIDTSAGFGAAGAAVCFATQAAALVTAAAGDDPWKIFHPTVATLQLSSITLFKRMLEPEVAA